MTWGPSSQIGPSIGSKAANQTSINTGTVGDDGSEGPYLVHFIFVAVDNNQTTDGDEGAVTSVTDTKSNTYVKLLEFCNGQGAAQGGTTVSVWASVTDTALNITDGDSVTANFSNNTVRDASAVSRWRIPMSLLDYEIAGSTTAASDGAAPSTVTISSLENTEYLWINVISLEAPVASVGDADADYTITQVAASSGGAAGTNQAIYPSFRIFTGTTDTWTAGTGWTNRDTATCYLALRELLTPRQASATLCGVGI